MYDPNMLALVLSLLGTPIPADVSRCIAAKKMWVAAPEFFEALTLDGQRAYQILDKKDGRTGHLLVMPERCRIIVFIEPGAHVSIPPGTGPTAAELRSLLKWAGFRERKGADAKASRTFSVLEDAVWLDDGKVMQVIDLKTERVLRFQNVGVP